MALIIGLILGIISRLADIYTTNLSNILSGMNIFILIGVLIIYNSKSKKKALINIFLFSIGLLLTYYITYYLNLYKIYTTYIIGWTIFSLLTPIFGYLVYLTKEKNNLLAKIIKISIIIFDIIITLLMFDRLRIYDYIILIVLGIILFKKKPYHK